MKHTKVTSSVSHVPDYKKIYTDLITLKYPDLLDRCKHFLEKDKLLAYDVMQLSGIITGKSDKETDLFNAKHKSYDVWTISKILNFQKENHCSNQELATKFGTSRNTITKWKKVFSKTA
ncbi:helix-turn-helix domain-containing protein [Chryseobacterium sp. ISL-6]|uniref:helix-turn-helix domain-containing protein n=1 Tax=Chryseobacterium sp. ISL-6 TaxID=2819143 RepID=UPI001BE5C2DB|nr:helix-turn-helix domain-containing protein [Chryseobacterium sp. ISL-6]MBT2621237.1 helix-turn-helix domain-containing protein [Chryseobacterium sp. ISL-6]